MSSERDLFFARLKQQRKSIALNNLKWLLDEFPTLVSIENDGYELVYHRMALIQTFAVQRITFNMTAFERGLKHLGLKCVQTTHKVYVKKWRVSQFPPPPAAGIGVGDE